MFPAKKAQPRSFLTGKKECYLAEIKLQPCASHGEIRATCAREKLWPGMFRSAPQHSGTQQAGFNLSDRPRPVAPLPRVATRPEYCGTRGSFFFFLPQETDAK